MLCSGTADYYSTAMAVHTTHITSLNETCLPCFKKKALNSTRTTYASAGISCRRVSVCVCVSHHMPVLCQNGYMHTGFP